MAKVRIPFKATTFIIVLCAVLNVIVYNWYNNNFTWQKYSKVKNSNKETIIKGFGHRVDNIAFSSDGKLMAVFGGEALLFPFPKVQIIDVMTNKSIVALPFNGYNSLNTMHFLPSTHNLLVSYANKTVLYNANSGKQIDSLPVFDDNVNITRDGRFVSGDIHGSVCDSLVVWDLNKKCIAARYKYSFGGSISPDGQTVCVAHKKTVQVYSRQSGKKLYEIAVPTLSPTDEHVIYWSPNGHLLEVAGPWKSYIIDMIERHVIKTMSGQGIGMCQQKWDRNVSYGVAPLV